MIAGLMDSGTLVLTLGWLLIILGCNSGELRCFFWKFAGGEKKKFFLGIFFFRKFFFFFFSPPPKKGGGLAAMELPKSSYLPWMSVAHQGKSLLVARVWTLVGLDVFGRPRWLMCGEFAVLFLYHRFGTKPYMTDAFLEQSDQQLK